jgi:two-component system phosphate regulon sensor histidine kinase PhoR
MIQSLRGRIAVGSLAASGAALLVVFILAGPRMERRAVDRAGEALLVDARLVAHLVEGPLSNGAVSSQVEPVVAELASDLRARITIMDPEGRVLADSLIKDPRSAENDRDRPEVRAALISGSGTAIRPSGTAPDEFYYAAVPVRHLDRLVGIARVAVPMEDIEAQVRDLRNAALAGLAVAVVATAVLSGYLTTSFASPLHAIMRAAQELAQGNLDARIGVRQRNELGELASILNGAVAQLQARLAEGARDRVRTDAILSAMEDGVLAVDDHGIVLLANDILRRNLDLHDPLGRHYVEVIRQREVGEVLQEVLKTGERQAVEVPIRNLRRVYALTGVPFPGTEGSPRGAVLTFHDITERRRLEQVRRDFVANASHELRTPLTSIRGFVEALEDGAVRDARTAQRFLGKIHLHSDRMASLVEDLLELSRLESGERPPRWEEVSPAEVAEDVVASFSGLADRKGTTLVRKDLGERSVVTDADRLRRILENLVDNAVKYTPEGGRVELATGPGPGGGAVLEVKDNGHGIPPEHLPRIFERFYRVDKARSRELGGTGLGLAIVKHLAEGMGASVTVQSEVGKGTCFTLTLPPGKGNRVA